MSTNKIYRRKRVNFLKIYPIVAEVQSAIKGITKHKFELLMALDDIVYFTKRDIKDGVWWGGWNHYEFEEFMEKDLIEKLPGTGTGKGNPTRYKLTLKARAMVTNTYKMCYGEKPIPESTLQNPIMKGKTYSHKKMARYIINHNKQLKS